MELVRSAQVARRTGRVSLRRRAAMLAAGLAVLTSGVLSQASPAAASTCEKILGTTYCGAVVNSTPWTMTTTETINSGPNWCKFANYGSGRIHCTQVDLGPWGSRGGHYPVDIDGFTYNYNDFYMGGIYYTRGVWIKFASNRTIHCRDGVAGANRPWCEG